MSISMRFLCYGAGIQLCWTTPQRPGVLSAGTRLTALRTRCSLLNQQINHPFEIELATDYYQNDYYQNDYCQKDYQCKSSSQLILGVIHLKSVAQVFGNTTANQLPPPPNFAPPRSIARPPVRSRYVCLSVCLSLSD